MTTEPNQSPTFLLAIRRMKRHSIFIHRYWMDVEHKPLECIVTHTVGDTIYYRPMQGGSPMTFTRDEALKYIASIVKL